MGQIAVLVVAFLVCVGVVFLLANIRAGGPALPSDALEPWDWPMTPVGSLGCMGYWAANDSDRGLLQQLSPDEKGQSKLRWPPRWYHYKDEKGNLVKGTAVAQMGRAGHYKWVKDAKGDWVKGNQWIFARKGDHKDCCTYLRNNGFNGAGVFEPENQLCYVFDFMDPLEGLNISKGAKGNPYDPGFAAEDFANVFPLFREQENLKDIASMPPPPNGSHMYMVACGGEGNLPCDYASGAAPSVWDPTFVKTGCSQTGHPVPYPGKGGEREGTAKLFRTPLNGKLPYSNDEFHTVCQTAPWINWFGWNPMGAHPIKGSDPPRWNPGDFKWPTGVPTFDPKNAAPYNFNTSTSRFMMPSQYA